MIKVAPSYNPLEIGSQRLALEEQEVPGLGNRQEILRSEKLRQLGHRAKHNMVQVAAGLNLIFQD
jgi:hypothetical protein